ncbi:MAG: ribonuclease H-like domain-containing protein [Malacoplasma sp.]|nr:ribonuclease H-like domain-containing protein [Malacoplasma sp.]
MLKDLFKDRKIVIFDIKTTEEGLDSEILYFAARIYINNEMISKHNFFITTDKKIPGSIIRKYRITNKKIESEGIDKMSALENMTYIFQDAILFTYNGDNFVFPLLEKIYRECGYNLEISEIDALKLAKQIIGFDEDVSLEELAEKLGVRFEEDRLLGSPYTTMILEKIWFRLKSFIIS